MQHSTDLRFIDANIVQRFVKPLADCLSWLMPNRCGLCGAPAMRGQPSVCARCMECEVLPWQSIQRCQRCVRCGIRLFASATEQHSSQCGNCLKDPPPFAHTLVFADYVEPWRAAVQALKFGHRLSYAALFAELLAERFAQNAHCIAGPLDWVLPVPLSTQSLQQRGFNQAWEITRRLAKHLQRPAHAELLVKIRETPPQSGLSRSERLRNVRGAFAYVAEVGDVGALQGKRIAVVDDVMTSGATLREIAKTLQRAGALEIVNIVVARTPERVD